VEILRRIGVPPVERGSLGNTNCPDLFELTDGRFAAIGEDVTEALADQLAGRLGPNQRVVVVTFDTLAMAKEDIPAG
jgi:hypothetical protein